LGDWCAAVNVSRPVAASWSARLARHSIGAIATRCWSTRVCTTTAASRNAASGSPTVCCCSCTTFVPSDGHNTAASGASACAGDATGVSGS